MSTDGPLSVSSHKWLVKKTSVRLFLLLAFAHLLGYFNPLNQCARHVRVEDSLPSSFCLAQQAVETKTFTRWNDYRIGDGISLRHDAPGCEMYPDSVVCAYSKETTKPNDKAALVKVLSRYSTRQNNSSTLAFLHVRLGDGLCAQVDPLCRVSETKPDCWNNDADCWFDDNSATKQYAYSRRWYYNVVSALKLTQVSKIVVTGDKFHWTRTPDPRHNDFSVDDAYLANVAQYFRSQGFSVCVKDQELPDIDFVILCSARVFVQGGGGYSALIAEVVQHRGGLVIRPTLT
jgi:hypothetical protein